MSDDELLTLCDDILEGDELDFAGTPFLMLGGDKAKVLAEALRDRIRGDRWVPCDERLPAIDEDVLIAAGAWGVIPARRDRGGGWVMNDGAEHVTPTVTHWRPLPAPTTQTPPGEAAR